MRNFRLSDESGHQEAIIEWCAWNMQQYPELELLYHVPNGGKRDKATAAVLKRQGVKAGVPDLVLPVARCGYHGLYIELKAPGGSVVVRQIICTYILHIKCACISDGMDKHSKFLHLFAQLM